MSSSAYIQARLGQTLIDFSKHGAFPEEEDVSAAYVEDSALPAALKALEGAKADLEDEIRHISRESAPDVDTWIAHAKSLQDDIEKSRRLASSIVRQAEADEERLEAAQEKRVYTAFLSKETTFNKQLLAALRSIERVTECLNQAEQLVKERKVLDALRMLEESWDVIQKIPADKSTRAVRLLDTRAFELRAFTHEQLLSLWESLMQFDLVEKVFTVNRTLPREPNGLEEALTAVKSYKELDKVAKKLWYDLDKIIMRPRTDLQLKTLPVIEIYENTIKLGKSFADHTIKSLFVEIEAVIRFLMNNIPQDLLTPLSEAMMPTLSDRIKEVWLETAVPASLDHMVDYQKALAQVNEFALMLDSIGWPGSHVFFDWVANSPKIWLSHRREISLDWTRNQLSLGIGVPQFAEKSETGMVDREEGRHMASTGTMKTDEWNAAWDDSIDTGDQSSLKRNRASIDEERRASEVSSLNIPVPEPEELQEEDMSAWGWGDDDGDGDGNDGQSANDKVQPEKQPPPPPTLIRHITPQVRQITLKEKYWISSMPQPVLKTVTNILDDGARLIQPENEKIPVAPAAPGLFSLPTLILAMYRAVSPFYYANDPSGNMYLYNDSVWLSDKLRGFVTQWKERDDLPPRAYGMVKLDAEIKVLESFGKRAYTNELNSQRTIINDLLGGAQNFLQTDSPVQSELEEAIKIVIKHIRSTARLWERILPYSAWASAVGSLVNAIANKLINDVFEMTSMSVDEAETTATILKIVEELDDLFVRKSDNPPAKSSKPGQNGAEDAIPMTPNFADKWMKMKFLSEALQSNLKDIKFLWFESDLSFYFTVDEVVDLIGLSFENNAGVRAAIKEIKDHPTPRTEE